MSASDKLNAEAAEPQREGSVDLFVTLAQLRATGAEVDRAALEHREALIRGDKREARRQSEKLREALMRLGLAARLAVEDYDEHRIAVYADQLSPEAPR